MTKRDGARMRPIEHAFEQNETLSAFSAAMRKPSSGAFDTKKGDVWKEKNEREDAKSKKPGRGDRGGFVESKSIGNKFMLHRYEKTGAASVSVSVSGNGLNG